jgi:hypothetical protein
MTLNGGPLRPVQGRASMSDFHRSGHVPRLGVSADSGMLKTLVHLWPYIWPADRPDL